MNLKDVLTVREASQVSGYSVDYVRRLVREGKLQATRFGASMAIQRKSLEDYMKAQGNTNQNKPKSE